MRSGYKKLGKYIQEVNDRDTKEEVTLLLGVSIEKIFKPSIANTIGTDMSTYKIVKRNQFAYGPVTSRNGDKISIALLEDYDEAIVSQAYTPFEIIDTNVLLPEYLMMWFRRPEFDRYARFMSHGSAREIFNWEEMCNTELPIPHPDTQREIVKEYNTIVNRIKLNEQLCAKLEETAQAIYKRWFVDFEFPDDNGQPYKSSGGEMEWCEELKLELPRGWTVTSIKEFCVAMRSGGTPSRDNPEYWNSKDIPWLKTGEVNNKVLVDAGEYISLKGYKNSSANLLPINSVLIAMYGDGKTKGQVGYLRFEATTNQACCSMICENEFQACYLYYFLFVNRDKIANMANGGAQPNLSKELIENLMLVNPPNDLLARHRFEKINYSLEMITRENIYLNKLKDLLHSKLATIENLAYQE